ncbi:MAG: histone deacetylase family protein [Acidimicrobiales bacterium]
MTVLLATSSRFLDHDTGAGHPERPARLTAVLEGIHQAGVDGALAPFTPRPARRSELELVHTPAHVDALDALSARGGGVIDADTVAGPASWEAALLAAGAGVDAIERLDRGEGQAAFCAVRPPGHHATPGRAMGFCLLNNLALSAAVLAERGERVAVVDWDVHHGNGTQDVFWADGRVLYTSLHQWPFYPGTGALEERGTGAGEDLTLNLPLPAGATGDVALAGLDRVVGPAIEAFSPTWVLVSAGFDAHRADPIGGLAWSSGDYAELTRRVLDHAPAGRRLFFLEGGYDLGALAMSAGACIAALAGHRRHPEPVTSGGPGMEVIDAAARLRR